MLSEEESRECNADVVTILTFLYNIYVNIIFFHLIILKIVLQYCHKSNNKNVNKNSVDIEPETTYLQL